MPPPYRRYGYLPPGYEDSTDTPLQGHRYPFYRDTDTPLQARVTPLQTEVSYLQTKVPPYGPIGLMGVGFMRLCAGIYMSVPTVSGRRWCVLGMGVYADH